MEPKDDFQKGVWWAVIATILAFEIIVFAGFLFQKTDYLSRPPIDTAEQRRGDYEQSNNSYISGSSPRLVTNGSSNNHRQQNCCQPTDGEQQNAKKFSDSESGVFDLAAQEGMWRATNALAYLTVAQSVIGVAGLAFIIWTLITQRDELREARKTTKAQRAFILWDQKFQRACIGTDNYVLTARFKNFGQTPALGIRIMRGFSIVMPDDPFPIIDINTSGEDQSFHIGPGQCATADVVVSSAKIVDLMERGDRHLAVGYRIEYVDVFGDANEILEFAMRYHLRQTINTPEGEVNAFGGTSTKPNFTYSDQGNEAQTIRSPSVMLG